MKKFTKLLGIVLIMALVMSMGIMAAFAADDGSITVTNATPGRTYAIYKIFTASVTDPDDLDAGVTYTATAEQKALLDEDVWEFIEDADGNYTVSVKTGKENAAITDIIDNFDALNLGKVGSDVVADETGEVEFTGLAYGYYYITSSLGTIVTIDTAGKAVEVVDKNESVPTPPDKEITEENEDDAIGEAQSWDDKEVDENDAAVGAVQEFTVKFDGVNWTQDSEANTAGTGTGDKVKVTEYNFKDTPTNLEIDADSVTVTVNGTDVTSTIDDIAVDANGVLTFTIPWVDDNGDFLYVPATSTGGTNGNLIPVVVTYNATITEDAAYQVAPNKVEIYFNNTFDNDHKVGEDTTTTYTYKFKLLKTDENDQPLEGAEFELYLGSAADEDAPALTFTVDADGNYVFDPAGTVTHIAPVKASSDATEASATILGLDNASYMLREVVVPTGYNKADDQAVTGLTKETNTTAEASTVDPGTTTIKNQKGTVLPSTGGIGTTIFYVVGSILVVAAGVLLITKKRMSREG